MTLPDTLDLLSETDWDLSLILRVGALPPSLLHTFACDCAERLFRLPFWSAHPSASTLLSLLHTKRLWLEGRVTSDVLRASTSALQALAQDLQTDARDGFRAVLAAALLEPLDAALQASEAAAGASFDHTFDLSLDRVTPLLAQNPLVHWLQAPRPAWQKLSDLLRSPRHALSRLSSALRLGSSQIIEPFRTSFSARSLERSWQRLHLASLIRLHLLAQARLLATFQTRLRLLSSHPRSSL